MKTNKEKLVKISVCGEITHPKTNAPRITTEGKIKFLPGTGGITYNVQLGDKACGFVADHVEPGVSIANSDSRSNDGLNILASVGNEAKVITGDAKGEKGYVTGKHGGIEHVLVYFPQETLEKLNIGDKIQIKAWGTGLEIEGCPDIKVYNTDPELLEKMNIKVLDDQTLEVPVVTKIPAHLMGSGIGAITSHRGDYDIMTADKEAYERAKIGDLRFGDIVLLEDCDNSYGRGYLKGAVSIGVIVHSDCVITGHGPGVTTLLTCQKPKIKGVIDPKANIGYYLGIL
ncbi:protein of unknown function [Anaerobranca californiensis DSM 14826]|jgi:hypothetical protein|uniref:DUF4438 domain-containing protein n=1 Tax=Anaerobranca californiensis DSM 14826 TaxID=1120989 RepID=A0A1M6MJ80_9FIRM|nr:DUF4438 domain-containing protein [Anaerobranca californiensis]SHJ83535.1 protein of unknown function [Anaerobranca californiensis DSM 14826]